MKQNLKYFGTDGIRGKYGGDVINENFAFSLGLAFAYFLEEKISDKTKPIFLAQDTRTSGQKLLTSCMRGLQKKNFNVSNLGIMPTPTLAFSVVNNKALGGIMVTASHNPHQDNGLKIISDLGAKLTIEDELSIEGFLTKSDYSTKHVEQIGNDNSDFIQAYIKNLSNWFEPNFLAGWKIVIDPANGATQKISPLVFKTYGAEVICINKEDGLINEEAGTEFTQRLSQRVILENANLGIAHDGDGDRVVFIDKRGFKIHGDKVLGILALQKQDDYLRRPNGFVATIHSNSGLEHSLKKEGVDFHRSDVGDRNVFSLMQKKGINWGGESSGHIICSNYLNTGDGLFSALSVLKCLKDSKTEISTLANKIKLWPSVSVALKTDSKKPITSFVNLQNYLKDLEKSYPNQVRVLIRYSGTEPKIRILVEALEREIMDDVILQVKELVKEYI